MSVTTQASITEFELKQRALRVDLDALLKAWQQEGAITMSEGERHALVERLVAISAREREARS